MTTSRDAGEDLLRILDELDTLIASARSMPMSASAIVHRQDALELIEKARESVPRAVRRAEQIVADADAVLAQGKAEAERIVLRAQEEAERLAASENVVRMANDRADAIVSTAEERAGALRRGADEYSDLSLAFLEAEISRLAEQVRAGREVLAGRLGGAEHGEGRERAQEPSRRFAGWSVDPTASH